MGILGNSKGFLVGFVAGFGTGLVTREVFPNLEGSVTPLLKTAMRSGIAFVERTRELASRTSEVVQDNWAEVQMELQEKREGKKKTSPDSSKISQASHVIPLKRGDQTGRGAQ